MRMKFKDVPTWCRVSFIPGPGRPLFTGMKVDVDMAQRVFPEHGFMFNIRPDELVTVVFKRAWRVQCLLAGKKLATLLEPVVAFAVFWMPYALLTPSRWFGKLAVYKLNPDEHMALYEEAKPLTERIVNSKLQSHYDAEFNKRSVVAEATPSPAGLLSNAGGEYATVMRSR